MQAAGISGLLTRVEIGHPHRLHLEWPN